MDFLIGCNYWASNAGTEMWRNFEPDIIDKELSVLSAHGISCMRVFPLWRDFQPVEALVGGGGNVSSYTTRDGGTEKDYYLDEVMLERFSLFTDLCDKYNISLVVGLITGWMSGCLFTPPALYGKNVITDPFAQYLEQLFIKGFVDHFKDRSAILAWDLGNECNCMYPVSDRWQAASWTAMISNAIRAIDPSRPIVSGMHGLSLDKCWRIVDQGEYCDILTTHPYPLWCDHTTIDATLSIRTTSHPTAQNKLYSELSGRPCLTEEMGTMGPMICSDAKAADYMRVNLISLYANGSLGAMWWCANDQTNLSTFPYTAQMVERELGLMTTDFTPKPVLKEIKAFCDNILALGLDLTPATVDAVCLLSRDQRHWGVAYMTFLLAKAAGMNISFADSAYSIPDSDVYLLPSPSGIVSLELKHYNQLRERVRKGATLYISLDNAIFSEFNELCGVKVIDSYVHTENTTANVFGNDYEFIRKRRLMYEANGAEIIARDDKGYPFITSYKYGSGNVILVNAPIEDMMIDMHDATAKGYHRIYRELFKPYERKLCYTEREGLAITHHATDNGEYAVIVNHTENDLSTDLTLKDGYAITETVYGSPDTVRAYDGCIIKIEKV